MTELIDAVQKMYDDIASNDDNEEAHILEDTLYKTVLLLVAEGHPESQEMAKTAIRAMDLPFSRWYA